MRGGWLACAIWIAACGSDPVVPAPPRPDVAPVEVAVPALAREPDVVVVADTGGAPVGCPEGPARGCDDPAALIACAHRLDAEHVRCLEEAWPSAGGDRREEISRALVTAAVARGERDLARRRMAVHLLEVDPYDAAMAQRYARQLETVPPDNPVERAHWTAIAGERPGAAAAYCRAMEALCAHDSRACGACGTAAWTSPGSCTDLDALRSGAALGRLGESDVACLELALSAVPSAERRAEISGLLVRNARAAGGGDAWIALAERHLARYAPDDFDVMHDLAVRRYEVDAMAEAVRLAEAALAVAPSSAPYRVYRLHRVRVLALRFSGDPATPDAARRWIRTCRATALDPSFALAVCDSVADASWCLDQGR